MADSATAVTEPRVQQAPGRWTPWLALAVSLADVASYVVSMVLPYYVNDLDRFRLEDVPWGRDHKELWPYDGLAGHAAGLHVDRLVV